MPLRKKKKNWKDTSVEIWDNIINWKGIFESFISRNIENATGCIVIACKIAEAITSIDSCNNCICINKWMSQRGSYKTK